jgi:hypothetical protein
MKRVVMPSRAGNEDNEGDDKEDEEIDEDEQDEIAEVDLGEDDDEEDDAERSDITNEDKDFMELAEREVMKELKMSPESRKVRLSICNSIMY